MDFKDRILYLAAQIPSQLPNIKTEEATKNALIMPFIQALGYDVFNLNEVNPELVADVGVKKGEKVDYAIMRDGKPIILFECKTANTNLEHDSKLSQLYRYFSVTEVRFGVLTNGVEYRFFTDLEAPNRMDTKPFLVFNMLDIKEPLIDELKKFTKGTFDVEQILSTASQLKYSNEIKRLLAKQLAEPEEEFVRLFASQVYHGRITPAVREQFQTIVKQAFRQFVNEQITERLTSALKEETEAEEEAAEIEPAEKVTTTDEEHEAFLIVRAILREVVDVRRVVMRDTQSYCGVLLDDNNRKPICRLHLNGSRKYLGVFDAQKQEERLPIETIDDIYKHAERVKAVIALYEITPAAASPAAMN